MLGKVIKVFLLWCAVAIVGYFNYVMDGYPKNGSAWIFTSVALLAVVLPAFYESFLLYGAYLLRQVQDKVDSFWDSVHSTDDDDGLSWAVYWSPQESSSECWVAELWETVDSQDDVWAVNRHCLDRSYHVRKGEAIVAGCSMRINASRIPRLFN